MGILALRAANEQAYSGEHVIENAITVRAGDTLQLRMNSDNPYDYYTRRSGDFKIAYNNNDEKVLYSNDVRLIVRSTTDSVGKVHVEKKAEGSSFEAARETAEAIEYNYTFENNALILDGYLTTDVENKYRDQEVEIVVYLPEGSILIADENTYSFHRNYARYDDILNNGDEGQHLLIHKGKTECLDCPVKAIDNDGDTFESEDWQKEVERKFKSNDDVDRIIIDEDGLDINFTDEEDTIRIKLNNQINDRR